MKIVCEFTPEEINVLHKIVRQEYRIKEHCGIFTVQKKYMQPKYFLLWWIKKEVWHDCNTNGDRYSWEFPYTTAGIRARFRKKKEAKEFLKTLLERKSEGKKEPKYHFI